MTIKGTLETFNLPDLLQMLAFNQKVGTLVVETPAGPRTLYVDGGAFGFVAGDPMPSRALARVLRRTNAMPAERLARGLSISANSGRFLGDALLDLGVLDVETKSAATTTATSELAFDLLQSPLARFEFVEGKRLAPNGAEGEPILPLCAVDGFLIDLTRKQDEWSVLRNDVPSDDEVYERTGVAPDVSDPDGLGAPVAGAVLGLFDGTRTVSGVVEESDQDRFDVVRVVATALRQGVLQAAPTAVLLSHADERVRRGKHAEALPLLRRLAHRGDAPAAGRLLFAEALRATGDETTAATELEGYATAVEASDPLAAFDALRRAQDVRRGDLVSCARACDLYLRHASRLAPRRDEAVQSLRALIAAATTAGRPAEAAARLSQFLERGDAPPEDLLVLSDLWSASGHRGEAAQALVRRSEGLIHQGRASQATEILRRALALDSTRADARRRLNDLETVEARRKHRRRVAVLVSMLGLTALSAGAVYLVHDGKSARAAELTVSRTEGAAGEAEATASEAIRAFGRVVDATAAGSSPEGALTAAVATVRRACETASHALRTTIARAEDELADLSGSRAETARMRLRDIEARRVAITTRCEGAVKDVDARASRSLELGEKAYGEGRFRDARTLLQQAERLSSDAPGRASRARKTLAQVDAYVSGFSKAREAFESAVAGGKTDEAWRLGCRMLATYLDSDLTREVLLPVPVTSEPRGATMRLGASTLPTGTPATVRYSPFGDLELLVRTPGCVPQTVTLPSFAAVHAAEASGSLPPFKVAVTLAPGPRWVAGKSSSAGPFDMGGTPWVAAKDGLSIQTMRPVDGSLSDVRALPALSDRVRALGRSPAGLWFLVGLRTFILVSDGGAAWQYPSAGRLDKAPAIAEGTMLLADDTGVLHGLEPSKGVSKWRSSLDNAPAQPPLATPIGFVVTTVAGDVVLVNPADGRTTIVVQGAARKPALAAAWGDGILVVGGRDGLATVTRGLDATARGAADPDVAIGLTLGKDEIAWVERSGGVRVWRVDPAAPTAARDRAGAVDVVGAGAAAFAPALGDGAVYAVGKDNVLRAARLSAPSVTTWKVKLPAPAMAGPVVAGELVLVRTEAGIAAYER